MAAKQELILFVDLGASLTKAIFSFPGKLGRCNGHAITMSPHVYEESNKSKLPEFRKVVRPDLQTWIGFEGKCFYVGQAAEPFQEVKLPKLEIAITKILALTWVIHSLQKLDQTFSVSVHLVLPTKEYRDSTLYCLQERLKAALNNFQTPTGNLQVLLNRYKLNMEGSGSFNLIAGKLMDSSKFIRQDLSCMLAMLGFRNFTGIMIRDGRPQKPITSDMGMHFLLEKVVDLVPGQKISPLLKPLALAGSNFSNPSALTSILRSRDLSVRQREIEDLKLATTQAIREFLESFLNFLQKENSIPETFYWFGGTADFLEPQINEIFPQFEHHFQASMDKVPDWILSTGYASRFLDLWGIFLKEASESKKEG
jgi:hypothetical protein